MAPAFTADELQPYQAALLEDPVLVARLGELRGWTEPAMRKLGLGLMNGRVLIPYYDAIGVACGTMRYQPNPARLREGESKTLAAPGSTRELFPAPETLGPDTVVWIVEGEPDSIAMHSIDLQATGVPGSSAWKDEWTLRFKGRHVVVCCDCDSSGRKVSAQIAGALVDIAASVRILDLDPARDDGYDLSDLIREATDEAERAGVRSLLCQLADAAAMFVRDADRPPRPRMELGPYRQILVDHLDGKLPSPAWPIPFRPLLEATEGGIRPGEVWVIAGWTSMGKSVYSDMLGDSVAAAGGKVHNYLTEMTVVQRGLRHVARATGFGFRDLRSLRLSPAQIEKAKHAVASLPYASTVVTDWTPGQVAADVRASRTNVAIVDLLHGFEYHDEKGLRGLVDAFARAATSDTNGLSGSAIVLVAQLNDGQMRDSRSPRRPKPGMHSIKGSSWIKQRADVVVFVHREDDDDGNPTDEGEIWIAKNRNGDRASVPVRLDTHTITFEERS